jgi:DNA-binding CsgD family transcriptional regulator
MEGGLSEKAPLVGRTAELERIVLRLGEARPAAFMLAGAPGVGKTRLATEVAEAATRKGFVTAAAAGSTSSIPFGPFAPFLPVGDPAVDLLGLLQRSSEAIVARAGPEDRLLLIVDDAHLLDDGSAALVHQLVQTGACSVLATVRTHEPSPDPITALWKDGLAERLELDPLTEAEVAMVVAAFVGGAVDGASVRRLFELSQGNPLYLRELVIGASASGAFAERGGIWALHRPLTAPDRLVELIAARLERVAPETVEAIQVVATSEPLPLAILERLSSPAGIEDAERRGFVEVVVDGRRSSVRLAHPLYGEALRQTLPEYRLRRLSAALAAAVLATGARRREDLLRLGRWQLDAGPGEGDPELLGRAARRAMEMFDLDLAERLAARALELGGGVEAGLVLGEALFRTGRLHEAEGVLAALAPACGDDNEISRVANARAYVLHTLIGDPEAASAVLGEALSTVTDEPARLRLLGRQATIQIIEGRPLAALETASELLRAPDDSAVARATFVASISLGLLGRCDEAIEMSSRGLAVHRRAGSSVQLPEAQLIGEIVARIAVGDLAEAEARAGALYEACLAAGDRDGQATALLFGSYALVEQGRPLPACRGFLEGASINRELQDVTALRWCLGGVALAEGMCGHPEAAQAALAELDGLSSRGSGIHEFDVIERGRAWALVAAGELTAAREVLQAAADRARACGQVVAEARLLHDLARLGDPGAVAARLEALAATAPGPFLDAFARNAAALAHDDAHELETAGLAFEDLGAKLLAAEADLAAALGFRREALLRREAELTRRVEQLLASCEGAHTPALAAARETRPLTWREREIAALAAGGSSSREIADKLVLSVRTVDNHLQNVYGKLGVSNRAGLAEALRES